MIPFVDPILFYQGVPPSSVTTPLSDFSGSTYSPVLASRQVPNVASPKYDLFKPYRHLRKIRDKEALFQTCIPCYLKKRKVCRLNSEVEDFDLRYCMQCRPEGGTSTCEACLKLGKPAYCKGLVNLGSFVNIGRYCRQFNSRMVLIKLQDQWLQQATASIASQWKPQSPNTIEFSHITLDFRPSIVSQDRSSPGRYPLTTNEYFDLDLNAGSPGNTEARQSLAGALDAVTVGKRCPIAGLPDDKNHPLTALEVFSLSYALFKEVISSY